MHLVKAPRLPQPLTKVQFMDLTYGAFSQGAPEPDPIPETDEDKLAARQAAQMYAIERYGNIIKAARESANGMVIGALERYKHATVLERDDVAQFLAILVADVYTPLSQSEADAIIANWPSA